MENILSTKYITDFEAKCCHKKGGISDLKTVEDNVLMLRYIIGCVLGLSPQEYEAVYGAVFNQTYGLYKYINKILELSKIEAYFGTFSKRLIFSIIYPEEYTYNEQEDFIRSVNTKRNVKDSLSKVQDKSKIYPLLHYYLCDILNNCMQFLDDEKYYFLSLADEKINFTSVFPVFDIIKKDYYCLLDFYFLNLPKEERKRNIDLYLRYRLNMPEGLQYIPLALKKPLHWLREEFCED